MEKNLVVDMGVIGEVADEEAFVNELLDAILAVIEGHGLEAGGGIFFVDYEGEPDVST